MKRSGSAEKIAWQAENDFTTQNNFEALNPGKTQKEFN